MKPGSILSKKNDTMHLTSKKTVLLILALTSILFSRAMFVFFDDPEGPNVLIVMIMSGFVYALSLAAYLSAASLAAEKRLLLAIFLQAAIVAVSYLLLK